MKKLLFLMLPIFILSSCVTTYYVAPEFTEVDKIVQLNAGMSLEQVNTKLGVVPYNSYSFSDTVGKILVYNYRIKERRVVLPKGTRNQEQYIHSSESHKGGEDWYRTDPQQVFIHFKEGKLHSYLTNEGLQNVEYVALVNGNLKLITKEDYRRLSSMGFSDLIPIGDQANGKGVKTKEEAQLKRKKFFLWVGGAAVVTTILTIIAAW